MENNKTLIESKHEAKISSLDKRIKNPWMFVSMVLGIALLLSLVFTFKGSVTGNVISENEAGTILTNYLNAQTGGGVEFVSSADKGNLYEISVSYQGRNIPVYITKDGEYFVQGAVSITGDAVTNSNVQNTPTEVAKSDKPKVEAFIFSYCPYGLQFEKALFPVYDLFKDKVDFNIVAIGAMHGEFEKVETLRQISIQELYGKEKLFLYLKEFNANTDIGNCRGDDTCLNKYLPSIYSKLVIDKSKVDNYRESDAEKIYEEQVSRANSLGISGSPTFVVNGAEVQVARNPNAIKEVICSAFNTIPSECSQALSSTSTSAGFGSGAGSASSAAQC